MERSEKVERPLSCSGLKEVVAAAANDDDYDNDLKVESLYYAWPSKVYVQSRSTQ